MRVKDLNRRDKGERKSNPWVSLLRSRSIPLQLGNHLKKPGFHHPGRGMDDTGELDGCKEGERMRYDEIRENLVAVVGIGFFVVGICVILKEGFTTLSLAWFVLGCLGICTALLRIKRIYVAYVLFFTFIFLLNYLIGSVLRIYKFRTEGLLYWYAVGIIVGSVIYYIQKRGKG
jgi:hypothetical protein